MESAYRGAEHLGGPQTEVRLLCYADIPVVAGLQEDTTPVPVTPQEQP